MRPARPPLSWRSRPCSRRLRSSKLLTTGRNQQGTSLKGSVITELGGSQTYLRVPFLCRSSVLRDAHRLTCHFCLVLKFSGAKPASLSGGKAMGVTASWWFSLPSGAPPRLAGPVARRRTPQSFSERNSFQRSRDLMTVNTLNSHNLYTALHCLLWVKN